MFDAPTVCCLLLLSWRWSRASMKEEKQNLPRPHVLKTVASQTVSGPVMFLQACDGVMCTSELTVGRNLHVSCLCYAVGYLRWSMIVLFRSDQQSVSLISYGLPTWFFFLLHLAWSTIQLWSPNFSLVLLDVAGWHENALWDILTLQVAFDANWIHDVSQEPFACNFSISSHFASSCHSRFSHASQTVVSLVILVFLVDLGAILRKLQQG